jgi:hypothetical protein
MANIHPNTWIWLAEVNSYYFDAHRVTVAADDALMAKNIVFARYPDARSVKIVGNGMRLLSQEITPQASRKA